MCRRPHKKARTATPLPSSAGSPTPDDPDKLEVTQDSINKDGSGSQLPKPMSNQEELIQAKKIAKKAQSSSYRSYHVPQLSQQLDKNSRRMIVYPCKMCGTKINWLMTDSLCSNLLKHAAVCLKRQSQGDGSRSLASLGISGTGEIDLCEVTQLYLSLKSILHPTVLKNLPHQHLISKAIHQLYTAVQENVKSDLKSHTGALYLGVDAWQSPNRFDILGVVVYHLCHGDGWKHEFNMMPLDFIQLSQSHTGVYLAKTIQLIVEKFDIKDKICGIVSNNASNNKVMVNELKKLKWPNFKGEAQWICCFAHILNLIAKAILRPFGPKKRKRQMDKLENPLEDISDNGSDDGIADAEKQIELFPKGGDSYISGDEEENPTDLTGDVARLEDPEELDNDDIDKTIDTPPVSVSKLLKRSFQSITQKLNKSPNSKALFLKICEKKSFEKPHNIKRDVATRWNSTLVQLNGVVRCHSAILEWQQDKQYGVTRSSQINDTDIKLAKDLVYQPDN
ncbi:hypothetical protein PTTG_26669 [Puccinia triticina 1-1 BBBD Race 1]|uniref:DUF659 domain-containing protein n=1 Tax=Puccinia triticina (isolate 1-1 / race 1 (BBBD)) TaxID=630390 RepID=A0A180GRG9_PUCT1|nr:hypothetical protein PTTG_26669 [Puccinia triticina 1-1 BBBD Race 1]